MLMTAPIILGRLPLLVALLFLSENMTTSSGGGGGSSMFGDSPELLTTGDSLDLLKAGESAPPDLTLEDFDITLDDNEGSSESGNDSDKVGGGLCVPQDSLDDLEWFPSFADDMIFTKDLDDLDDANHSRGFKKDNNKNKNLTRPIIADGGRVHRSMELSYTFTKKRRSERRSGERKSWRVAKMGRKAEETPKEEKRESSDVVDWLDDIRGIVVKRRCTHCLTDRTPQWRVGPRGPKSLCNACGVRWKSGRLSEHYRPASSPSFNNSMHSNFHKLILKRWGKQRRNEGNRLD